MSTPELQEVRAELQNYRKENANLKMSLEKLTQENINLSEKFSSFQNLMNETIVKLNIRRLLSLPKTCSEIYKVNPTIVSDFYTIFPENNNPLKVYCEVTNQMGMSSLSKSTYLAKYFF